MQDNNKPVRKNSQARINANNKYKKANYKRIAVDIRPDQAEKIRETAQRHHLSLAQLIITAVDYFDTNHSDTVTASDTEENTTTTEDTAERIPEYIKNMIDRSKAYDKDFSEKQRAKRKVERERAKAEYNLID